MRLFLCATCERLNAFSRSSLQLVFFFCFKIHFFSFPFRRHGLEIPAANDREGRGKKKKKLYRARFL